MTELLVLLTVHFVGDFLLQSSWMALNKSKRWDALALHVAVYSACFFWWGWMFVLLTFALHFVTDAVTSRLTSLLWFLTIRRRSFAGMPDLIVSGDVLTYSAYVTEYPTRHWFFAVIGFDQLLHVWALALTYQWAIG